MSDWWTEGDTALFSAKTAMMDKQTESWTYEDKGDAADSEAKVGQVAIQPVLKLLNLLFLISLPTQPPLRFTA